MNQYFSLWKSSRQLCIVLLLIRGRSNRSHDSGWLFPPDYLPEELLYSFQLPHSVGSVLWRTALPAGQSCELHPAESMKWLKFHNISQPRAYAQGLCRCLDPASPHSARTSRWIHLELRASLSRPGKMNRHDSRLISEAGENFFNADVFTLHRDECEIWSSWVCS